MKRKYGKSAKYWFAKKPKDSESEARARRVEVK